MTGEQSEWLRIGVGGVVPIQWSAQKADDGSGPGTLEGWASVYNVIDQQDDIVVQGAFRKTIERWRATNRVIPLTTDHEHNVDGIIGSMAGLSESPYGLKIKANFSSVAKAQDARVKAKEGHLAGLSIFGPIFRKSFENRDGREIRLLHEVGLQEVALTGFPANEDAGTTAVKTAMPVHHTGVVDQPWEASTMVSRIPNDAGAELLRGMFAAIRTGADPALKGSYVLPHHQISQDGRLGPANLPAVRNALARLGQTQGLDDATRAGAQRHLQAHLDDANASSSLSLPHDWVEDMRAALTISVPHAQKAAVDMLVAARYGSAVLLDPPADDGGTNDPAGDESAGKDGDYGDAAEYALTLIGEGPGTNPPGGEQSLADLMASIETVHAGADLDRIEAELTATKGNMT